MNGKTFLPPLARLLMSSLFVWDGIVHLRNPGGTAQYFASVHIPAPDVAVWISILVHLLGGLALLAGFYARWAAALLALVCLGTAFGVHLPTGRSGQHDTLLQEPSDRRSPLRHRLRPGWP
jgi:putative oxidoreductase